MSKEVMMKIFRYVFLISFYASVTACQSLEAGPQPAAQGTGDQASKASTASTIGEANSTVRDAAYTIKDTKRTINEIKGVLEGW
jgi:hypothetical protein